MNQVSEALVAVVLMIVLFALPMILLAWIVVTILSAPLGWILACIACVVLGGAAGYEAGRSTRR